MTVPEIQLDDDEDYFDENFLLEIQRLEDAATASSLRNRHQQPQQPPFPPPPPQQQPQPLPPPPQQQQHPPPRLYFPTASTATTSSVSVDVVDNNINYSPPRELSQRFTNNRGDNNNNNNNNRNSNSNSNVVVDVIDNSVSSTCSRSPIAISPPNPQIDFLKNELARVSKQLSDMKDECSMLRKERDKKDQLKPVHSIAKTGSCNAEASKAVPPRIGISPRCENLNAIQGGSPNLAKREQKSVGIQTDISDESSSPSISGTTPSFSGLPKLLTIWSARDNRSLHKKFVAKLLETCATDFCALFGFLGLNMTSKDVKECFTHKPLPAIMVDPCSSEAIRASQLYSVLNELSNDVVHINAFLDILLDLCELENALVVHKALRILRVAVGCLLSTERVRSRRDNVQMERCLSGSDNERIPDSGVGKSGIMYAFNGEEASIVRVAPAFENISSTEHEPMTRIDWVRLFTSLSQSAVRMTKEHLKVEAVSIMNIILRGMDPYSERGQFGKGCVYEAVGKLLKKGSGLFCQKEVVHLVYLLLNCPSILIAFCSSCKETEGCIKSAEDGVGNFTYQASCAILDGFVDCLACPEHSVKELSLCRNAILVLAFLASSGKSGLDIFLFYKLSNGGNFLGLILQVLVLELDAEALDSFPALDISRERTLLMREALILLNRLASHPAYAASVLQVVTSCRDIVSLAIDIGTRLSNRSHRLLNSDTITKQVRESEVVNLATLFKKRIVTFLRETA